MCKTESSITTISVPVKAPKTFEEQVAIIEKDISLKHIGFPDNWENLAGNKKEDS